MVFIGIGIVAIYSSAHALLWKTTFRHMPSTRHGKRLLLTLYILAVIAPYGAFGVLGNHEYIEDADVNQRFLDSCGARSPTVIPSLDVMLNEVIWSDEQGPWLEVSGIRVAMAPVDLRAAEVNVDRVLIDRVTIHRQPELSGDGSLGQSVEDREDAVNAAQLSAVIPQLAPENQGEWPDAWRFLLQHAEITELILMPELTGLPDAVYATVSGKAGWEMGNALTGTVTIAVQAPDVAQGVVAFSRHDDGSQVEIDLAVQSGADRIQAHVVMEAGRSIKAVLNMSAGRLAASLDGALDLESRIPLLNADLEMVLAEENDGVANGLPDYHDKFSDLWKKLDAPDPDATRAGALAWMDPWLPGGEGALRFHAAVSNGMQGIFLEIDAGPMDFGGAQFERLALTATMEDVFGATARASLTGEVANAHYGDISVSQAELRLGGEIGQSSAGTNGPLIPATAAAARQSPANALLAVWEHWRTAVSVIEMQAGMTGEYQDYAIAFSGQGHFAGTPSADADQRIAIEQFEAMVDDVAIVLRQPLTLLRTPRRLDLAPFLVRVGAAQLACGASMTDDAIRARLDWQTSSLSWIPGLAERGFDAALEGRLRIAGHPSAPDVAGALSVSNIIVETRSPVAPWVERLDAQLTVSEQGSSLDINLLGVATNLMTMQAVFPYILRLVPVPGIEFLPDAPFEGHLTAALPLSKVGDLLLPDDTRRINGRAEAKLQWQDAADGPDVSGEMRISEGSYRDLLLGTRLQNIEIVVLGDRQGLVIDSGRARDRGNGSMTLDGRVDLFPLGRWTHEFRMEVAQMQLIERDEITASVDGFLTLAGNIMESELQGALTVAPVEIRLPERLPAAIPVLPVIDPDAPEPRPAMREALFPRLSLAVTIDVPNRMFVRSRAVDTEWEGALDIGGTLAEPEVKGVFNSIHGRFMVLGRRFRLQEGTIRFPGHPIIPFFDAVAETEVGGITAQLRLRGTPQDAQWELSSIPELPEDEILTRVFFNRPVTSPSPGQALRVAQAAEALAGGGHLTDVLEFGRRALRVDRIDYVEGETPEDLDRLVVGRYLGERGFVDLEKDMARAEGGRARVSYDVAPGITLETEIEADGERGIGLRWQWDY